MYGWYQHKIANDWEYKRKVKELKRLDGQMKDGLQYQLQKRIRNCSGMRSIMRKTEQM